MINGSLSDSVSDSAGKVKDFAPPATVIEGIEVCDLHGQADDDAWQGLVDTGASRTVVPLDICERLVGTPSGYGRASGYDELTSRQHPMYRVRLRIPDLGEFDLEVFGIHKRYLLLGRDFLSQAVLLYEGRSSRWGIGEGPAALLPRLLP